MPRPSPSLMPFCLFLSGLAALVYEVVWLRRVSLVMGHTSYATAALLSAFLGGLALGAWFAGRACRWWRPTAKAYALIELAVAGTALLVPAAMEGLAPAFALAYRSVGDQLVVHAALQFVLCATVLVVPTALMGATLPVVIAFDSDEGRWARTTGTLYAANTLGGVIGAAAAGLWLIPSFGELTSTYCAAVANIFAALFAVTAASPSPPETGASPQSSVDAPAASSWPGHSQGTLLALYAAAGVSSLVFQVAWARILGFSFGSTLYGFTITLVGFIAGIGIGSALIARLQAVISNPVRSLFALHALIAVWTAVSVRGLEALPAAVARLMATDSGFFSVWVAELGLAFASVAGATLAMGGIFVVVADQLRRAGGFGAAAAGRAYAANTAGNIGGSIAGGFVLIPALGMQATLLISAILSAAVAIFYAVPKWRQGSGPDGHGSARRLIAGVGLAMVAAISFGATAKWDLDVVASAPFLAGYQSPVRGEGALARPLGTRIDQQEGPTTLATVRRWPNGAIALYAGGILESTDRAPAHDYLAHLGLLLAKAPKRVLVIGLGAGNTLAAAALHPVDSIECLEIAPEIIALSTQHFASRVDKVVNDPRVSLRPADGRAHLRYTAQKYDVIISQPSYPWATGAARLFTRAYFADVRARLNPGGVAVAWFTSESSVSAASLIATWRDVFGRTYLFSPSRAFRMYYAVGFVDGQPDPDRVARRVERAQANPDLRAALAALGITSSQSLLRSMVADPERAAELSERAPLNTDDNGWVELELFRTLTERRFRSR